MTTILHITFNDDNEAQRFAEILAQGDVIYPADLSVSYAEQFTEPQSVTAIGVERDGTVISIDIQGH